MGFIHGRLAEIVVDGTNLSTYCDTADLAVDVDTSDTTTFGGDGWKTAIAGLIGATTELAGNYSVDAAGPSAVLSALLGADEFPVLLYPGGNVAGRGSRGFSAILTNYKESTPVGDKVTFSASLLVTGAVEFGTV